MDSNESPKHTEVPSWLTVEYVTEVLRKGENDSEITVDNIDIKSFLEKGENYASFIQKLIVTYRDGNGHQVEKPLIIKSFPQNPLMQHFLREGCLFDKEIYAYSKLFPTLANLTDTPLASAKFYPTERDDIVILEDMSTRDFRMADRKKRLDLEHSLLALKTLARFHGLSYAVVERDPAVVDHFPESMYAERMKEMNSRFMTQSYNFLASIVETWPGYERFGDKIRFRMDGVIDEINELTSPKKDAFNVLNHGDYWVNNMLFRYNNTQEPEEVCLIDLQVIRYGSPALDLHYFLSCSLADGLREEYEDILLEAYHKELSETLTSVALESVTYTLEDLKYDFQEKAAFGFFTGCLVIGAVAADPSEVIDLDSLTEESFADGSSNPLEKTFQGKRFRDVLQKHLLYYEGKNVL